MDQLNMSPNPALPRTTSALLSIVALPVVLLLSGCIGPLNPLSRGFYERDLQLAQNAEYNGDYVAARKAYILARAEADTNFLGKEEQSCAVYNIARMNGLLGYFEVAEAQFGESLALEEKVYGRDGGHASLRWFELARLYEAWGRYQDSAAAYEKGFVLVDRLDAQITHPAMYAVCLQDFADVLDKVGESTRAQELRTRVAPLGGQHADVHIKYYPKKDNR